MTHIETSHVARRNVWSHTYECATAPGERVKLEKVWMFHVPHTNTPPLMSHIRTRHLSCPTYEHATSHVPHTNTPPLMSHIRTLMSHIRTRHLSYMNEARECMNVSCPTDEQATSHTWMRHMDETCPVCHMTAHGDGATLDSYVVFGVYRRGKARLLCCV